MGPQEILQLVQSLTRIGIPLSRLADVEIPGLGPLGALLGVANSAMSGNIPGAVGGAARLGSGIANMADLPGVGSVLGSLGGPIGLGTGIASGNPVQALMGAAQTGSSISGLLGGPTISSLIGNLASGVGGSAATGGAAGAGMAGTGMAMAPLAPLAIALGGTIMGALNRGPEGRAKEREANISARGRIGDQMSDRIAGAGTYGRLGEFTTPEQIAEAFRTASQGARAQDIGPDVDNLSAGAPGIGGLDLSEWKQKGPELDSSNWASYLALLDKAQQSGVDWETIAEGTIPGPYLEERGPGTELGSLVGKGGKRKINPIGSQDQAIEDYQHGKFSFDGNNYLAHDDVGTGGDPDYAHSAWKSGDEKNYMTTGSAYDMSKAIQALGGKLGVDWNSAGPDGESRFGTHEIRPDEMESYGFTPGNYGAATLNYLKNIAPEITSRPEWADTLGKMGLTEESFSGLPQGLKPLSRKLWGPLSGLNPQQQDWG